MNLVKRTVRKQVACELNNAAQQVANLEAPRIGWIKAMRTALAMSAPALAKRLGVTKPAIYQVERRELNGGVTLNQMERSAKAMGGKFIYAIVPDGKIEDIMRKQAHTKAKAIVEQAHSLMALEKQALSPEQNQEQIKDLTEEFLHELHRDFWDS